MSFTTVDDVKLFLNKESLTPFETAQVERLIPHVDAVINNYCGWNLLASDYENYYNGDGTATLDLKVYPLNTLTSVTLDDEDITSDVTYISKDGVLTYGSVFTSGTNNVKVVFNAGFVTVPQDLQYAADYLVVVNFNRITQENIGISRGKFNNVEVDFNPDDLPKLVTRVLDRYRHVSIY